jgi:hypothetical protein
MERFDDMNARLDEIRSLQRRTRRQREEIEQTDQIVYQVVTKGGGIDGMDHTDKGGKVKFASFDREEAEKQVTAWDDLKLVAMSGKELLALRKKVLAKLDGTEKLVLELPAAVRTNNW